MKPAEGRSRVVIEDITPQVDCGRYPARRILGDNVLVTAAIFGDGHDHLAARLLFRRKSERRWRSTPMQPLGNDLWSAEFPADEIGMWEFTVQAWVDHFDTWTSDLHKRLAAQPDPSLANAEQAYFTAQDIPLALRTGALLLEATAKRARGGDARILPS